MNQKKIWGWTVVLLAAGCGGQLPENEELKELGENCSTTLDCQEGAVCSAGVCRQICQTAADCLVGYGCVEGICDRCLADSHCGGGYRCNSAFGICLNSCSRQSDCVADFFCDSAGHCQEQKEVAGSCQEDGECRSGFCREGYCCDSDCHVDCMSCALERLEGFCSARPLGAMAGSCQGQALACDEETNALIGGSCDGQGQCVANLPGSACGAYLCRSAGGVAECYESCQNDRQCAADYSCLHGACVQLKKSGEACLVAEQCESANCVDDFCCDSACGNEGYSCNVPGFEGICRKAD